LRTVYHIIWPVKAVNNGSNGISLEIDTQKLVKIYPFLKGANFQLTRKNVNPKPSKKKSKSREEQAKKYRKLLASGKVKNKAALARKFGVSRAWITKVLS